MVTTKTKMIKCTSCTKNVSEFRKHTYQYIVKRTIYTNKCSASLGFIRYDNGIVVLKL